MGRHREFDVEQALDDALCVFWCKGYEGASYTDLTQAIGVQRPALYAAFGNKEALFIKVLERYYQKYLNFFPQALELPTSREVVSHIFQHAIELNTRDPQHAGCLGVHGALAGTDDSQSIRDAVASARAQGEGRLRDRLERAKQEGEFSDSVDCATLAAFVCAMLHGMAVQAKAGFSREKLQAIADFALSTWPSADTVGREVAPAMA